MPLSTQDVAYRARCHGAWHPHLVILFNGTNKEAPGSLSKNEAVLVQLSDSISGDSPARGSHATVTVRTLETPDEASDSFRPETYFRSRPSGSI